MFTVTGNVIKIEERQTKKGKVYREVTLVSDDGNYDKTRVKVWNGIVIEKGKKYNLPVKINPYQSSKGTLGIDVTVKEVQ